MCIDIKTVIRKFLLDFNYGENVFSIVITNIMLTLPSLYFTEIISYCNKRAPMTWHNQ